MNNTKYNANKETICENEKKREEKIRRLIHFFWIVRIGQTNWVYTSSRFMTNLEILIWKNKK